MNLSGVPALVVDGDNYSVGLMLQMLRGLGLESPSVVNTIAEAKPLLENRQYDLMICEAELPDGDGARFVSWLRHLKSQNRFIPVIAVTSYSHLRNVTGMRDAGAHIVLRKPVSPQALFDHIHWSAKSPRPFVELRNYTGPDRRFKFAGPPSGNGRRESDLSHEIGDAMEPNLSQSEIDSWMKPMKVSVE
jgi:CheY-like chemotaxis protein